MASTCVAVVVLYLIKQTLAIPGDTLMYMPPLEVRTLDMPNRAFPFLNPQLFSSSQQSSMQPQMDQSMAAQTSQPAMEFPVMQPVDQSSMMQPVPQPTMTRPTMQQLPMSRPMMQQPRPMMPPKILHHTTVQTTTPEPEITRPHERHNMTFDDFVNVLNEISDRNKESDDEEVESFASRAAGPGYAYSAPPPPPYPSYQPYPRPYGPPKPSYGPSSSYASPPPAYHQPVYAPPPPPVNHYVAKADKSSLVSSLFKPVATKAASKVSGLISIVLSLLSGTPSSGFSGFKDIVVNGIIKPLLVAKGGIKSLISKLAVPVISLLLINLEVLITVWWMWDDCPQPEYYPPPPPPPPVPVPIPAPIPYAPHPQPYGPPEHHY